MKVLLYPNIAANLYSQWEIIHWLQEIIFVCKQSHGEIELRVAIEAGTDHVFRDAVLIQEYALPLKYDQLSLATIKEREFDFDGILVKGRKKSLEPIARKLDVFILAFGVSPYPLDIWVLNSPWHSTIGKQPITDERRSIVSAIESTLNVLPMHEKVYSRFAPYTGQHADQIYDEDRINIMVPLYYYRMTAAGLKSFTQRLSAMAARNEGLSFLITPMSDWADTLRGPFSKAGPGIIWLDPKSGRQQILSLTNKVNAVLALDGTAALLPLLMGRPTCRDPKRSIEMAAELPSIWDWLYGRVPTEEIQQRREYLIISAFSRLIVPKHPQALLRFQHAWKSGAAMDLVSSELWNEAYNFDRESAELRQSLVPGWLRKLRKFRRDPYGYCADSGNPVVRTMRHLFRPSKTAHIVP